MLDVMLQENVQHHIEAIRDAPFSLGNDLHMGRAWGSSAVSSLSRVAAGDQLLLRKEL